MNETRTQQHRRNVFCADDNPLVTDALRYMIDGAPDLSWMGCAEDADKLIQAVARPGGCPDIVLLDIDMPGKNPFDAIGELVGHCRETRVLMYTGLVQRDLIDRAIQAGAWGYVSKSDGQEALLEAVRRVLAGEIGLSPEVQAAYRM
jgi:two-component system response regulator DesR